LNVLVERYTFFMFVHYNISVQGLVQGVFFRVSTRNKALDLGLFGFVLNEANGNVYIEVEGEQLKIDELLKWIKNGGPAHARVDDVKIEQGEQVNFVSFEIH